MKINKINRNERIITKKQNKKDKTTTEECLCYIDNLKSDFNSPTHFQRI